MEGLLFMELSLLSLKSNFSLANWVLVVLTTRVDFYRIFSYL